MSGRHLRRTPASVLRALLRPVALFACGAVVGIGGVGVVELDEATSARAGAADLPAAPTLEVRAPTGDGGVAVAVPTRGPITLAFVGDIYARHGLADRLADDPDGFVGPFAGVLHDADLVVGNLEAAITTGGAPATKEFTFRAPPEIVGALVAGGIDIINVANNHGIDFGPEGLADTLEVADANPDVILGVGHDEDEAYAPIVRTVRGVEVAVIGATQVIGGQFISSWTAGPGQAGLASAKRVDRLVAEVAAARADADVVVVFLHWGVETEECPSTSQTELARALVGAGADVVVGSHAHRVQGAGHLGSAVVGYGLGNFVFHAASPGSARTGVLVVEVDRLDGSGDVDARAAWVPGRIIDAIPTPLDGDDRDDELERWEAQRACTGLDP